MIVSDDEFDCHGKADGAIVIALHGAVVNRKTWLPLARVLPPEIALWCPDLPGHGARRDVGFTLAASLDVIDALLARAAPRRAIVAGDSLGGYLALVAGARRDPRIAGIVAGGCTWSMTGWRGMLARASDAPTRIAEACVGGERMEAAFAAVLPRVTDSATARAIVAAGLRARSRSESLDELRGIDVVALARQIDVPLAIMNGRFDYPTRALERAMRRANPGATLTLGRSGHAVGFFAPTAFLEAIVAVVGGGSPLPHRT